MGAMGGSVVSDALAVDGIMTAHEEE